jgi:hypothetical protein
MEAFDPPSHEDDVKRGFGTARESAKAGEDVEVDVGKVQITNYTPAFDAAADKLATAMAAEFGTFMRADHAQWTMAALGVLSKMHADVTSGDEGIVIVTLP